MLIRRYFTTFPSTRPHKTEQWKTASPILLIPGASSHPGQVGNTVLSGHSSNDVFAAGDYKFIFMQLDKLEIGDTIYANYEGVRYTYIVTGKEEVLPSQVDKLIYPTDKPVMTLITCTPLAQP